MTDGFAVRPCFINAFKTTQTFERYEETDTGYSSALQA